MEYVDIAILKGISDGERALRGPKIVQIDLTGKCNSNCIGCWVHSPYVKSTSRDKNISLSFDKAKNLIIDLAYMEVEEIFLSGAGDPFLHSNILEIIELIKNRGLKLNIMTNFALIDDDKARRIIDLGVDQITASVWAGTEEAYLAVHPNKVKEDFYKLRDNLRNIALLKREKNKDYPLIKIYNVICNRNYNEINEMFDFALDTQAEFVEYQVMDIIKGQTDFLSLNNKEVERIKEQFQGVLKRNDLYFRDLGMRSQIGNNELREFPGRLIALPIGFSMEERMEERVERDNAEINIIRNLTCPKGFSNVSSVINPLCNEENNKLVFKLDKACCQDCSFYKKSCPANEKGEVVLKFLVALGFSSFMRRLSMANCHENNYETDFIDNYPCYVGWLYSRVLSTGEVIPCCKAVNKPLGNINEYNYLDIWNSQPYRQFRCKAKSLSKRKAYFKKINCYKSCDNVGMNIAIHQHVLKSKTLVHKNQDVLSSASNNICFDDIPRSEEKIIISAAGFKAGNLSFINHEFGKEMVIDGGSGFGFAEYEISVENAGRYELWARYASEKNRPVELYVDGNLISNCILSGVTGGWYSKHLKWFREAALDISPGLHILKIFTNCFIPHIHSFALLKVAEGVKTEGVYIRENILLEPLPLKLMVDKIKTIGFFPAILKLFNYFRSGRFLRSYLDILGIYNGQYAFCGPSHVQIDLTYNCNNNCIACWCNSPLLGKDMISQEIKGQTLPFSLVKELLDELAQIGTKEIYFSGGGEPFMHPEIMEILAYAKKKNFTCYVNTNFTLLNVERIKKIIDLGVDHLTVSTWAATAKTYALTHPGKGEDVFRQIVENLKFLNRTKLKTPYVKLYNVISNLNYRELKEMILLAKETASESVEFTLVDTKPGRTDKLLLDSEQTQELRGITQEVAQKLNANGFFDGVLLFKFDTFLRRISSYSDLAKATYDRNIIDKIPCYVGWCFSRIMPNGDVNACLKAHRIPTGNLFNNNFQQIWNSPKQRYFRGKTLVCKKEDDFFRLIGNDPDIMEAGCYKSCDDIGRNTYIHNRIMSLTVFERELLKIIVRFKRKPNLAPKLSDRRGDSLIRQGIMDGRRALVGPEQAVIDITNSCNQRCVGCWLYSPLLKDKISREWLSKKISFNKLINFISALAELGTKRIRFTGGGEPFAHPEIMKLIEHAKSKGLICCLTTNFSLLNKTIIKDLIRMGVDELAVSLWAADKESYQRTHPGAMENIFEKIEENLMFLNSQKKGRPFVTLCNVVCNLNYLQVEEMLRFALKVNADGIYFTLLDALKGTDSLLLNEEQKREVLRQVKEIQKIWQGLSGKNKIKLDYFDGFISRIEETGAVMGNYDQQAVNKISCYAGWTFVRVLADGSVVPCCRGVKKIMGNIQEQDFKDIWFSDQYNEFRAKAKYLLKTDPYFSEIGCLKMCDNLMHNKDTFNTLISAE